MIIWLIVEFKSSLYFYLGLSAIPTPLISCSPGLLNSSGSLILMGWEFSSLAYGVTTYSFKLAFLTLLILTAPRSSPSLGALGMSCFLKGLVLPTTLLLLDGYFFGLRLRLFGDCDIRFYSSSFCTSDPIPSYFGWLPRRNDFVFLNFFFGESTPKRLFEDKTTFLVDLVLLSFWPWLMAYSYGCISLMIDAFTDFCILLSATSLVCLSWLRLQWSAKAEGALGPIC